MQTAWERTYQNDCVMAARSARQQVRVFSAVTDAAAGGVRAFAELNVTISSHCEKGRGNASAGVELDADELRELAAFLVKHADRLETLETEAAAINAAEAQPAEAIAAD